MTLDERLRGAAQEVKDEFEALEPARLAEPATRPRYRAFFGPVVAAVAFLVVLIAGAGLLWLGPFGGEDVVDPAGSAPDQITVPTVVEDEGPAPSPATTVPPKAAEPSAPITGINWQQVTPDGLGPTTSGMTALVSGGDRFLYVESAGQVLSTSFDGENWTRQLIQGSFDRLTSFVGWQDTIVGFGCGGSTAGQSGQITPGAGCVSVIHADGTVARQSFDGEVDQAGIGPSGIVVIVTETYDENGLQYADEDLVAMNLTGRDINQLDVFEVTDGVLRVEYDGQVTEYVLSDYGYTFDSRVASGWFSQDGEEWIPIPDFPAGENWDLVGTEDGFIAISDSSVWHSSDGLAWRELGQSPGGETLSRWSEGAIVVGAESAWFISGSGIVETAFSATGLEPSIPAFSDLGMIIVDIDGETMDLNQILYSPDGQAWTNTNVPSTMIALDLTWSIWHYPVEVVTTDTSVLLLLNVASDGDSSTLIWVLGTPITD